MTSKQFSPSATSSIQTRYYQPVDTRLNSSYSSYATVSNRFYHHMSLPYASNAYGVYRRMPAQLKGPFSFHPNLNRRVDVRNRSRYHPLSTDHSPMANDLLNTIVNQQKQREEKNSRDIFHYTYHHPNVSVIAVFLSIVKQQIFLVWRYSYLPEGNKFFFFRVNQYCWCRFFFCSPCQL